MESFCEIIRKQREEKGLPLRVVAAYLDIDQAILSKIETGNRKASREQVIKLAEYYKLDPQKLLVSWLADKIIYEAGEDDTALQAIKMAEEVVIYKTWSRQNNREGRRALRRKIARCLQKSSPAVSKAWLFGSFARGDDSPQSDIDLLIDVFPDSQFTLLDIAGIQYDLQLEIDRKVDVVMLNGIRPEVKERIKKDMELIYEA